MAFKKKKKKNQFSFPKTACESPKYALKGLKSTTHRGKNYFAFFKSAFGGFWHFFVLNLAFSAHWHPATTVYNKVTKVICIILKNHVCEHICA
jgi:hypothetical protein